MRELYRNARGSLAADRLRPALATVEAKTRPRSRHRPGQIRSLIEQLQTLPDYRSRIGIYPLWSLVAICLLAHLCGAPRGQKDSALFAQGLSQAQRRALGIRRQRHGTYPAPSQPTFCRLMKHLDDEALEQVLLQVQEQIRGPVPQDELIVIDGKPPRQGGGPSVLTATTVPGQFYLGSGIVQTKTNEIPVARELFHKLDLDGRKVSLEALHTQVQTARELVLEHGADYLLTVQGNQPSAAGNHPTTGGSASGAFFPLRTRRPRWRAGLRSTRANPNCGCCACAASARSKWDFPLWNKWRWCGGICATTPPKGWL